MIHIATKAHKEQNFTLLYKKYYRVLFLFAYNILQNKNDCEDVIADTFTTIWNQWGKFENIENPSSYLYKSVKNNCLMLRNRQSLFDDLIELNYIEILIDKDSPEVKAISNENLEIIYQAINSLPEKCKLIFLMAKEQGLSYKEIAEILNISPKTVHAQISIAISKINDILVKADNQNLIK